MQTDSRPLPPPFTWLSLLGSIVLGVVVGAVGTVMHRSMRPWGLVLCLVLVAAAALVARAWGGRGAWGGFVVAASGTVWLLSTQGPGGDVLVPAHQAIGWIWIFGAPVVSVVVALLPASLFDDRLRPPRGGHPPVAEVPASQWPPAPGAGAPPYPGFAGPDVPRPGHPGQDFSGLGFSGQDLSGPDASGPDASGPELPGPAGPVPPQPPENGA